MSDAAADSLSVAIEELVEQFAPLLRATCRRFRIFDDEAEELRQDVRIRLWRAIAHGRARAPCPSYCQRIVMSAATDITRRRRGGRVSHMYGVNPAASVPAECLLGDAGPDRVIEWQEIARQVDRAVAMLAPPRDVVVRLYLAGFDRIEIAERFRWSEPKVRNLLYRGLNELRLIVAGQGIGPDRQVREKDPPIASSL